VRADYPDFLLFQFFSAFLFLFLAMFQSSSKLKVFFCSRREKVFLERKQKEEFPRFSKKIENFWKKFETKIFFSKSESSFFNLIW